MSKYEFYSFFIHLKRGEYQTRLKWINLNKYPNNLSILSPFYTSSTQNKLKVKQL